MEKKPLLTAAFISALLFSAIAATQFVNLGSSGYLPDESAQMTVIKVDGSVDPASAPILRNGAVYTFVGDIDGYVVVERNNSVVDGAGHVAGGVYGPVPVQVDNQWHVDSVTNVTVRNTVVNGGGIIFYGHLMSSNLIIANNTINDGTGLDCSGYGNIIANNTLDSGDGICFSGKGNIVSGNHITNCDKGSSPTPNGISVVGSDNTLVGNFIAGTKGNAVDLLVGVSNNVIAGNQIIDNQVGIHTTYTISMFGAEGNYIYCNNFINNVKNVYNEAVVTTTVSVNVWDNGEKGNFWSDYMGTDVNGDGIGDTPYVIDASNQDRYPLMTPVDTPTITIDSLTRTPTPTPTPTPTSTPTPIPTPTPTPNLTPNPSPSSIPQEAEPQPEPKPFPTTLVAAASGVSAAIIGIGLLVYFKKPKR